MVPRRRSRGPATNGSAHAPDDRPARLLPHDRAAERAILSTVLQANELLPVVRGVLTGPGDFYAFGHQLIFRAIADLVGAGKVADVVSVSAWLAEHSHLTDAGGHAYMTDLWGAAVGVSAAAVTQHAELVRRLAVSRALVNLARETERQAAAPSTDPADVLGSLAQRVEALRTSAAGSVSTASRFAFVPADAVCLAARAARPEWHVQRILVANQGAILGGPRKSLKTTLLVALAVALATGRPFLGVFPVLRPRRVCIISGESGEFVILETLRRICAAQGLTVEDTRPNLTFAFRLPQLANAADLAELRRGVEDLGIEVLIIDPLYLCLLAGVDEEGPQASNLFEMGPLYAAVIDTCLRAGATPILAHHFKTTRRDHTAQPDLGDLAFAGVQEHAAQWILVSRREAFRPGTGLHQLWLVAGGRVGHSGCWGLDVNEGQLGDDFTGRTWDVQVLTEAEAISSRVDRKESEHEAKRLEKERAEEGRLLQALDELTARGRPATESALRKETRWGKDKVNTVVGRLVQQDILQTTVQAVTGGHGATRQAEVYRRAHEEE